MCGWVPRDPDRGFKPAFGLYFFFRPAIRDM